MYLYDLNTLKTRYKNKELHILLRAKLASIGVPRLQIVTISISLGLSRKPPNSRKCSRKSSIVIGKLTLWNNTYNSQVYQNPIAHSTPHREWPILHLNHLTWALHTIPSRYAKGTRLLTQCFHGDKVRLQPP